MSDPDSMDVDSSPPPSTYLDDLKSYCGEGAYDTARYFTGFPRLKFISPIGDPGAQGGALLYHERNDKGTFLRQLIVKYYDDPSHSDAEDERDMLLKLRGAEHIIQLTGDGYVPIGRFGLALLLEYVGHGDLSALIARFKGGDTQIPNRVLWSFFLCLVQACIGMVYPPNAPKDRKAQTETLPSSTPKDTICHGDMHCGNILVAANDTFDPAHKLGPIIKLIDFGLASLLVADTAGEGAKRNIYDIGTVMSKLVLRNESVATEMATDLKYIDVSDAWPITIDTPTGTTTIATMAPIELDDADITSEMQDLIYWCMAFDQDQRPTLQQALAICRDAVLNQTENDFDELGNRARFETDEAVRQVVRGLVLNAEVLAEQERLRLARPVSALLDPDPDVAMAGVDRKRKRSSTAFGSGGRNLRARI